MHKNDMVVVTGASSFVGAHLAVTLRQQGYRVLAGLTGQPGDYTGLRAERMRMMARAGVGFFEYNLLDQEFVVKEILRIRPDYWITHAGWSTNYSSADYDLDHAHLLHVSPYEKMFQAFKEVDCKGVIHTGTSAEYGDGETQLEESTPCWPNTPYALSKLTKTLYLRQLALRHRIPVRVVRLFLPYGPLDAADKFLTCAMQRLSRSEPLIIRQSDIRRDFLYIDDVCRGYLALLGDFSRDSLYDIFNICGGEAVALRTVAVRLAELLGVDPAWVVDGKDSTRQYEGNIHFGSYAKARDLLGWSPRPLEEGLTQFADECRIVRPADTTDLSLPVSLVRLSRSSIDRNATRRVAATLRQGYLGMGKEVDLFEQDVCRFIGGEGREVTAVNTGTAALQLALQACGIGTGDEVLVPTITYVASYQAISATGATPVSCEVRADDCLLDLADAAGRITPRTRAVMPVHYASNPALLGEVYDFARRHGLRVIEDAAHAFGCTWHGQMVGSFGDVVCFSFDGIKNITSGEGGAVVTGDHAVAEYVRNARLLGVIKDTEQRYSGSRSWSFDVTHQGWRYHMNNLSASLGRAQLEVLQSVMAPVRVRMANRYQELLAGLPRLRLLHVRYGEIVPHIFPVFIDARFRDQVQNTLRKSNIECGIHYMPNHLLSYYGGGRQSFPVAEQLHAEMLTLPMHAELTNQEQDRVVKVIRRILTPGAFPDPAGAGI